MNKGCSKKDKKERKEIKNKETETTFIKYKCKQIWILFFIR